MSEARQETRLDADSRGARRARLQPQAIGVAVGCFSFLLYLRCLCPTVYWSDSGELIASCVEPGIAHPNGSPVYTILGWLFSLLPVGTPAYRVNVLSAFSAALVVTLTFLAGYRLSERIMGGKPRLGLAMAASVASATAVAVAPGLWMKATVANKYPLAAAACAAILLTGVGRRPRPFLMGLLLGLGFGVHPLTLCGAPTLAPVLFAAPKGRRGRALVAAGVGVVVGLLPFIYLPLRSLADPARDWGDPETLKGFWWLVSGREFANLVFGVSPSEVVPNLVYCGSVFLSDLGPPALVLATLGALLLPIGAWCRRRGIGAAVSVPLLMLLADLALVVTYNMMSDRYTWEAYLLPSYAAIGCLACAALCVLGSGASSAGRVSAWIGGIALVLCSAIGAYRHYPLADKSGLTAARDHGLDLVRQVPRGTVLAHNASEIGFLLTYLDEVEGADTGLINVYLPLLAYEWYGRQLKAQYPHLAVPPASLRAAEEFFEANAALPTHAYPGALGYYIPRDALRQSGWLYEVQNDAEGAAAPAAAPEQIVRSIGSDDYDGRTVAAYLSLLDVFGRRCVDGENYARATVWLREAINTGQACRAKNDGDVRQIVSKCRLTLAMVLAAQKRWPEAEQQLAAAGFLHSARLRADREVRWGLCRARQRDGAGGGRAYASRSAARSRSPGRATGHAGP